MSRWIAIDWGTSNLRAYLMEGTTRVDEASSPDGMGTLTRDGFEPALLRLIEPWLTGPTPCMLCGMAGARGGWAEAPYGAVPMKPSDLAPVHVETKDPRLKVRIVPGLKQLTPTPDVMRGEETQIAGLMALEPHFDGVACLPGTHTKWAHLSAGEVVSFQTYMTGEMFGQLSSASVLKTSAGGDGWDGDAFLDAVDQTLSRPETLAAALFAIRASDLLHGTTQAKGRARLAGLLIGAEIAAAKPYWLGQPVALIGTATLSAHYANALSAQGVTARSYDATQVTCAGLARFAELETT